MPFPIAYRSPVRIALDRIRAELGMPHQLNACPECGSQRWERARFGRRGVPVEECKVCGGKPVLAANLLRTLAAHTREGFNGPPAGLGPHWGRDEDRAEGAARGTGELESVTPAREMGR